ncbi:MAG: hypothetical protein KGI98_16115 [Euryarchaeota archaeon]|nr:hypothetical protein [Euryarchaeota archaeon]MDE1879524.1 hypothetical protein [Euryarchaeota archaeon]
MPGNPLFALFLITVGIVVAIFELAVGVGGSVTLAWDTVLIGVSAGLVAAGSAIAYHPYVGFIVGPLAALVEALVLFGVPGGH